MEGGGLPGDVAVLSPHLDDAVFSLGAAMCAGARLGSRFKVVTVLGDDPASAVPAGEWDRSAGFATEGEAASARREEDLRACSVVGALPVWLTYRDSDYGQRADDDEIWEAVAPELAGATAVLIPGFPLVHVDHRWLATLAVARLLNGGSRVGLYVEQPYAGNRAHRWPPAVDPEISSLLDGAEVAWQQLPCSSADRRAKRRAIREYRSQLPLLSKKPFLASRVVRHDALRGGETVGWISRENQRS